MTSRIFRCVSLVAWVALSVSGCTPGPKDGSQRTLRLYLQDDVKGADPAQTNDIVSLEVMGNIFEGLLEFSYLGALNEVRPLLAEALPIVSDGGKTYRFRIRKGVLFHDDPAFAGGVGRELKAEDFVYSLKRLADPSLGSVNFWLFDGVVEGLNEWRDALEKAPPSERAALFAKPVKGFEAPSPYELIIRLKRPYPQLRFILAMTNTAVVAREVVEHYGPEIISHPVGTGAFKLASWVRGSKITAVRNPKFRKEHYPTVGTDSDRLAGLLLPAGKPMPFVDGIDWDIIKEEQPRWLKFRAGELDYVKIPRDNFEESIDTNGNLKPELASKNLSLHKQMSLTTWWLEFNLRDPLLGGNLKLRKALAHAFHRERALELLYNNRGLLSSAPLPPGLEGADDLPALPFSYNPEKAKQLLAEAGYPDGKGLPELTFDLRGPGSTERQLGELITDNFGKIGVKVSILANSYPEALEKTRKGRFQIMRSGWAADYPDPENFLQLFFSGNAAPGPNSANFKNAEYDKLYQQIRTQNAGPARRKAIRRMVEILQTELPAVFFYHQLDYYVAQPRLKNFKPHLLMVDRLGKFLDLSP
jgi:ABC-type transport system substrate-binding protein